MCGYVACVPDCCDSVSRNYDIPVHRPHNHTLYYDIPPISFVAHVTQNDLRSSLMMADYC
jgi:hypothetical protein